MKRLRELAEAATPGPWLPDDGICPHCGSGSCWQPVGEMPYGKCGSTGQVLNTGPGTVEDDAFVDVFDPSVVLALLDVAETVAPILAIAQEFTAQTSGNEPLYLISGDLGMEARKGELDSDFTLEELRAAADALARLWEVSDASL